MNMLLSVLQVLLALHTFMGALWKFFNPEQTVPSLKAIPHGVWLGISVVEVLCSVALVLPLFNKRRANLAVMAAAFIVAEMLLYCGLHLSSGDPHTGELIYWLVVAAIAAFIAWGRFVKKPA